MHEIYLYIRRFDQKEVHQIYMDENYLIGPFLKQVTKKWNCEWMDSIYSIDQKNFLNKEKTWKENRVISGDWLILM